MNEKHLKIILTALLLGFALWFGTSVSRTAVAYDLFQSDASLTLKDHYSNEIRMHNVYLFTNLALYSGVGFVSMLISMIFLLASKYNQLKKDAWLFMAFVLFFIAMPVQIYFFLDYNLATALLRNNVSDYFSIEIQQYFHSRIVGQSLTTINILSFLSIMTGALYFVWKPLNYKGKTDED